MLRKDVEELIDDKQHLLLEFYNALDYYYLSDSKVRNYDFLGDFLTFKIPDVMKHEDACMKIAKKTFLKKKKIIEYRDLLTKINQIFIYDIALVIASYILKNPNEQIF